MSAGAGVPLRKNRDFVLLQAGQTLSTIGSESTAIAYPLLVLALTNSPAKAGLVGFALYAACMLLLCIITTVSPSIRNAPSLSELDDLPTRTASPAAAG